MTLAKRVKGILAGCASRTEAVARLKAEGFKTLGRGVFSIVMASPEDEARVVRLTLTGIKRYGNWMVEDGRPAFRKWSQGHGAPWRKYVPRESVILAYEDWAVWCVERLYPIRGKASDDLCRTVIRATARKRMDGSFDDFMRAVRGAMQWGYKRGYNLDLHSRNVMRRADGSPVIVDPYVKYVKYIRPSRRRA